MLRFTLSLVLGISFLTPVIALGDSNNSVSAFLVATKDDHTEINIPVSSYETVFEELEGTLRLQNVTVINGNSFKNEILNLKEDALQQVIRSSKLSTQDFGISYALKPELSENSSIRTLTLSASGSIHNAKTGTVITTFNVSIPDLKTLPKDRVICNLSCVTNAVAEVAADLSRELSFVLTQKLHFIREDRVETDVTSSQAIQDRLKQDTQRKAAPKTIISSQGEFEIDVARSVNIEVYFDFDSYQLTTKASEQLQPLGKALETGELSSSQYLLAGHTDAKGSDAYNQKLSDQRAHAVRNYLVENYAIKPETLVPVGLGETQLKRPSEPNAGVNRRVEIALLLKTFKDKEKPTTLLNTYIIEFELFSTIEVVKVVRKLEADLAQETDLLKSSSTLRVYSIESRLNALKLEEFIMMIMLDTGIDIDRIRLSTTEGKIRITNL